MNSDSTTPTGSSKNHTPLTQLGKKDKKAG